MSAIGPQQKHASHDEQCQQSLLGLGRAVKWLEANTEILQHGVTIGLNRDSSVEICFGYLMPDGHRDERAETIHRLFAGREVCRRRREDGGEAFKLGDHESGILFHWDKLPPFKDPEPVEERVTL